MSFLQKIKDFFSSKMLVVQLNEKGLTINDKPVQFPIHYSIMTEMIGTRNYETKEDGLIQLHWDRYLLQCQIEDGIMSLRFNIPNNPNSNQLDAIKNRILIMLNGEILFVQSNKKLGIKEVLGPNNNVPLMIRKDIKPDHISIVIYPKPLTINDKTYNAHETGNQVEKEVNKIKTNKQKFSDTFTVLKRLGFNINEGIKLDDLYRESYNYKNSPFRTIYNELADDFYIESDFKRVSNNCWKMDFKYIEAHLTYIDLMENLSRISNDELVFQDLKIDYIEDNEFLSFSFNGMNYKWTTEIHGGYVDLKIFKFLDQLANEHNLSRRFTLMSEGSYYIIGYMNEEELMRFRRDTRIDTEFYNQKIHN